MAPNTVPHKGAKSLGSDGNKTQKKAMVNSHSPMKRWFHQQKNAFLHLVARRYTWELYLMIEATSMITIWTFTGFHHDWWLEVRQQVSSDMNWIGFSSQMIPNVERLNSLPKMVSKCWKYRIWNQSSFKALSIPCCILGFCLLLLVENSCLGRGDVGAELHFLINLGS